ncbi:MAG: hypothetical protein NZ821_09360, partial [Gloeomargarita sp. SKYB31]|nr:hypothetical protein [Gloeomargarita sp. SKYB31]
MTAITWQAQAARRWSGWRWVVHLIGLVGMLLLSAQITWGDGRFWLHWPYFRLALLVAATYGMALGLATQVSDFPRVQRSRVVLVSVSLCFLGLLGLVGVTRWYYSRT